jgi:hypothetical protein
LPGREAYENPQALPRFFSVERIRKAESLEQAFEAIRRADFDPRTVAVVEGAIDDWPLSGEFAAGTRAGQSPAPLTPRNVLVRQYSARRVVLDVESPSRAFLVTSETHYPGWKAWLDGEPAELFYTNAAFRGLPIPAGSHEVIMEFAPDILWRSAAVSGLAWAAWVLVWWKHR